MREEVRYGFYMIQDLLDQIAIWLREGMWMTFIYHMNAFIVPASFIASDDAMLYNTGTGILERYQCFPTVKLVGLKALFVHTQAHPDPRGETSIICHVRFISTAPHLPMVAEKERERAVAHCLTRRSCAP